MMKTLQNFSLLLLVFALHAHPASCDTLDSLYHIVQKGKRVDWRTANRLMVALDAEGAVDSFYTFTAKSDTRKARMEVSCCMGQYYADHQHHSLAAKAYHDMAHWAQEMNDTLNEADALAEEAYHYYIMGDFETAMGTFLEELRLDSMLADTARLASAMSNLASTHMAAGYPEDAARYIRKAIQLEESLPSSPKLAIRYGAAAEIFNKRGDSEEALRYAEKAYELDRKAGNAIGTARRLSQMADIYNNRGELERAEKLYLRAIDTLRIHNEPHSLGIDLRLLGKLCQRQGRWKESLAYLQEAAEIAQRTGNRFFLSLCAKAMADSYHAMGQDKQAFEHLNRAMALSDSMHTERLTEIASEYRSRYNINEQEQQIDRQQSILSRQQWSLVAMGSMLLLALASLFVTHRKKKALEREVNHKLSLNEQSQSAKESEHNGEEATAKEEKNPQNAMRDMSPQDRKFLTKVSDFIHANMNSQRISVDMLAEHMCMSRSQLTRRMLNVAGDNPSNYITRIKLEKSIRLLKGTNMSVKEIAWECGFDDSNYFIRVFRTAYGTTPQQYRNTPDPK